MTKTCSIYLAGKIQKQHEPSDEAYWSDSDLKQITDLMNPIEVNLLNPAQRSDDLTLNQSVFGRDMLQVFVSDVVWVDARDRRGLGVGAEMMWAKANHLPVITLAPMDTQYRQSKTILLGRDIENYVHPFVSELSDVIVSDIQEGVHWLKGYMSNPDKSQIKGLAHMHESMRYYVTEQLPHDTPMKEISVEDANIKDKIHTIMSKLS